MTHNELKMRCDLYRTGSNAHKVTNLYSVVISSIQLYLMNNGSDLCLVRGIESLHTLNSMLKTNFKFFDILKSYIPVFDNEWGCMEDTCLGTGCIHDSCIKKDLKIRAC